MSAERDLADVFGDVPLDGPLVGYAALHELYREMLRRQIMTGLPHAFDWKRGAIVPRTDLSLEREHTRWRSR